MLDLSASGGSRKKDAHREVCKPEALSCLCSQGALPLVLPGSVSSDSVSFICIHIILISLFSLFDCLPK